MIHDFNERLAFSQGSRGLSDMQLLKKAIPGCVDVRKTDLRTDKQGIDYIATLKSGAEIGIDAKRRDKGASRFWTGKEAELALEIWSVFPDGKNEPKKGWILSDSTNADLILFTFDAQDWPKAYLLPFQHLRTAFERNRAVWEKTYPKKIQDSYSWFSQAVFVPASVVIKSIADVMQIGVDVP